LCLTSCSVVSAAPFDNPFAELPPTHSAYRNLDTLAKQGVSIPYPERSVLGKSVLTRYDIAGMVQKIVQAFRERVARVNVTDPAATSEAEKDVLLDNLATVKALVTEFQAELGMLGISPYEVRQSIQGLERLRPWRVVAPDLAVVGVETYPGRISGAHSEYVEGYLRAAAEWRKSDVVFYTTERSGPGVSASTGLIYRTVPGNSDSASVRALVAGHNEEVRRRISRYGIPKSARRVFGAHSQEIMWRPLTAKSMRLMKSLAAAAKGSVSDRPEAQGVAATVPVHLTLSKPEAISPDGATKVRLDDLGAAGSRLRLTTAGRSVELQLPQLKGEGAELWLLWRPASEAALLLKSRDEAEQKGLIKLQMVDMLTGQVLEERLTMDHLLRQPRDLFAISKVNPFIPGD